MMTELLEKDAVPLLLLCKHGHGVIRKSQYPNIGITPVVLLKSSGIGGLSDSLRLSNKSGVCLFNKKSVKDVVCCSIPCVYRG